MDKKEKTKILKPVKKLKYKLGKFNKKKHINKLEALGDVRERQIQKKMNIDNYNYQQTIDSDFEESSSSSSSSSSDSDEFEFDPVIELSKEQRIRKDDDENDFNFKGIDIKYIPTTKDDIEERYLHKEGIVPRGYSNFTLINGSIGSGKTNCLLNMLMNPLIYGFDMSGRHFFDNLFVLTNSNDTVYDHLIKENILKPSNIKHQPEESDLKLIIDQQKKAIKESESLGLRPPNTAIIFDDIIDNKKFINSKYFKLCAIRPRQLFLAIYMCSQFFNAVPRMIRMQAQNLILFAGNKTEEEIYSDMLTPAGMTPRHFQSILNYAWDKRPDDTHPFIHINRKQPVEKRFMRNFKEYIRIPQSNNKN
jgi:hypothetical protein